MRSLLATETDCNLSLHWDEVSAGDVTLQYGANTKPQNTYSEVAGRANMLI